MPLGIMISDISFDVILVVGYAAYLLNASDIVNITEVNQICDEPNNSINETETFMNLRRLDRNIPNKLTGIPRFFYSLAFVVLPGFFYGIEFCHSRHLTSTIKQVKSP